MAELSHRQEEQIKKHIDKVLAEFKTLEKRILKVEQMRNENSDQIDTLKKEFKEVRNEMENVRREQNMAIHKVSLGKTN